MLKSDQEVSDGPICPDKILSPPKLSPIQSFLWAQSKLRARFWLTFSIVPGWIFLSTGFSCIHDQKPEPEVIIFCHVWCWCLQISIFNSVLSEWKCFGFNPISIFNSAAFILRVLMRSLAISITDIVIYIFWLEATCDCDWTVLCKTMEAHWLSVIIIKQNSWWNWAR